MQRRANADRQMTLAGAGAADQHHIALVARKLPPAKSFTSSALIARRMSTNPKAGIDWRALISFLGDLQRRLFHRQQLLGLGPAAAPLNATDGDTDSLPEAMG
jgi:hypothetical protein